MSGLDRPWDPDAPASAGPPPRNNMPWAVLTTLLFCLPFGIVSIVFARQVRPRWAAGEYVAAVEAATRSRRWAWWGVFLGVFVWLIVAATLWMARSVQGS